jgi:putative RNA 2'-phosphotransferase
MGGARTATEGRVVTLNADNDRRLSTVLSLVLRHDPSVVGISLDPGGWVDLDELVAGIQERRPGVTRADIERVVATNDKQRFALDETRNRIRANQGHSVLVDLGLPRRRPPAVLFHGTVEANVARILREGLNRRSRHAVHLSPDRATAARVGARRGRPAVLRVDAERMHTDGYEFSVSANGIWLVEAVPLEYLSIGVSEEG